MSDRRRIPVWVVLGAVLLVGIGFWFIMRPAPEWGSEYFDYGAPTPLGSDAPLREAFCRIRADFETLPEHLIKAHKQHSSWTERRFAAGRFEYGPVRQLMLTDAALAFTRRHSRAEIVAALAPLMAVPEGGRAAAVLAGLPVRSKAALSNTTGLAEEMDRLYRHDRTARLPLDEQAMRQGPPLGLYGATNTAGRLERPVRRSRRGSFETRLEPILEARTRLPSTVIVAPGIEPASPFRGKRSPIAAVAKAFPMPEVSPQLTAFATSYPREDLLIALFPYVAAARQGSNDLAVLIWANGLQVSHWPLAVSSPSLADGAVDELRNRFAEALLGLCD